MGDTQQVVEMVKSSVGSQHIRVLEPAVGVTHYSPSLPAFERAMLTDPKTNRWVERLWFYHGAI